MKIELNERQKQIIHCALIHLLTDRPVEIEQGEVTAVINMLDYHAPTPAPSLSLYQQRMLFSAMQHLREFFGPDDTESLSNMIAVAFGLEPRVSSEAPTPAPPVLSREEWRFIHMLVNTKWVCSRNGSNSEVMSQSILEKIGPNGCNMAGAGNE